jgi:nucleoside-diphosphate-sugar epimerase
MRILISGGAGCLGSNLCEHLLGHGHEILVIDNFATGRRDRVPSAVTLIEASIARRETVDCVFAEFRPTHIVHAAAAYKNPDDWREDDATNVLGTINLLDAARQHGVTRFINLQTALCYGRAEKVPIPVDHPCRPVTSYGISKTAGESFVVLSGLPFVSIRLASVIGPRLAIGVIPTFYQRLKSGKPVFCSTAVRDWLDVADFLAFMDLAMREEAPIGIFNLGPGSGQSMKDVLTTVAGALGVPMPVPLDLRPVGPDDVEVVVLDPTRTERAFGWRARVSFAEAIRRVVGWYDAHGVGDVFTHLRPAAARA